MNTDSKTVLVTGSTDGVGRVLALRLADQGARVLIHGRDHQRGDQVVERIRNTCGRSGVFLPADFSSLSEVRPPGGCGSPRMRLPRHPDQ